MKKADLKVGYLVKYRNGDLRMVMPITQCSGFVFVNEKGFWLGYEDYDEQLLCTSGKEFDIIEVYGFSRLPIFTLKTETNDRELLWQREDKKEMTIDEIKKNLVIQ